MAVPGPTHDKLKTAKLKSVGGALQGEDVTANLAVLPQLQKPVTKINRWPDQVYCFLLKKGRTFRCKTLCNEKIDSFSYPVFVNGKFFHPFRYGTCYTWRMDATRLSFAFARHWTGSAN